MAVLLSNDEFLLSSINYELRNTLLIMHHNSLWLILNYNRPQRIVYHKCHHVLGISKKVDIGYQILSSKRYRRLISFYLKMDLRTGYTCVKRF